MFSQQRHMHEDRGVDCAGPPALSAPLHTLQRAGSSRCRKGLMEIGH